jgi:hypothetical protein
MYAGHSFYKAKLGVTGKLNTRFLSREMTDGTDSLIANRKSVQDKSLILQAALNGLWFQRYPISKALCEILEKLILQVFGMSHHL